MPYARDGLGDIPSILQGKSGNTQETMEHQLVNGAIVPSKATGLTGVIKPFRVNPWILGGLGVVGLYLVFGSSSRRSLF